MCADPRDLGNIPSRSTSDLPKCFSADDDYGELKPCNELNGACAKGSFGKYLILFL